MATLNSWSYSIFTCSKSVFRVRSRSNANIVCLLPEPLRAEYVQEPVAPSKTVVPPECEKFVSRDKKNVHLWALTFAFSLGFLEVHSQRERHGDVMVDSRVFSPIRGRPSSRS